MSITPMDLETFILTDCRSAWVVEDEINLYLRHIPRMLENDLHRCLDIANVHTPFRGQGRFTRIMTRLEARPLILYIENITSPRLADWFARRPGYRRDPAKRLDVCFYRINR